LSTPFGVSTTTSYARRIALVWLVFPHFRSGTAALRIVAYGALGDAQDDYIRMAESIDMECMYRFRRAVVSVFGPDYMRTPNEEDIARIMDQNEERGFLGMLGSIDCMHWKWKNGPFALQGTYKCHKGGPVWY
jgi:hypothetical protein